MYLGKETLSLEPGCHDSSFNLRVPPDLKDISMGSHETARPAGKGEQGPALTLLRTYCACALRAVSSSRPPTARATWPRSARRGVVRGARGRDFEPGARPNWLSGAFF